MTAFTLLEQSEEDKLHATRLLGIEERPFKRLTKRLLAPNTPIQNFLTSRSSKSDDNQNEDDGGTNEESQQQFLKDLQKFREDVILDFAAFESSIARIQFLRAANEKERERYAAEKVEIEAKAQAVMENTANLRIQLDDAQKTLAIRKTYDVLADKITADPALRPRDEQHVNIEKLRAEIEELERESQEHSQSWLDRREQLSKVAEEGARLRRVVRDEKEPEKDDDADEDEHMHGVGRDRDHSSNVGTPRPGEDAATPMPDFQESGGLTPNYRPHDGEAASPRQRAGSMNAEHSNGNDVEMADDEV